MAAAPLPNWDRVNQCVDRIAEEMHTAAAEFANLQNIPVVQQNNLLQQIVQQLQQMDTRLQQMDTRLQQMDTRLQQVEGRLQRVEDQLQLMGEDFRAMSCRVRANDANALARTFNSMIVATQTGTRLEPLLSVRTGQPIPSFPATHEDLRRLHEPATDSILFELDMALPEGVQLAGKKEILRRQCGLTF